jgi:hypothetical protein
MRPFVALTYRLENVWTTSTRSASDDGPTLENRGATDAFDISVQPLTIDRARYFEFDAVPALPAHGSWRLGIHPSRPSLAAAISRRIVEEALAGRRVSRSWPLEISYRDEEGQAYTTRCEIRVVQLPLTIEAVVCSGEEATDRSRRALSLEPPAATRR